MQTVSEPVTLKPPQGDILHPPTRHNRSHAMAWESEDPISHLTQWSLTMGKSLAFLNLALPVCKVGTKKIPLNLTGFPERK